MRLEFEYLIFIRIYHSELDYHYSVRNYGYISVFGILVIRSISFDSRLRLASTYKMPNKCVAFGCKTGYAKKECDSDDNDMKLMTLHCFLKDAVILFDKWVKAISRKDFVL
jgi:hypothetical protein